MKRQIEKFISFLEKDRFKVDATNENAFYSGTKRITYDGRQADEAVLFTLLHEYGHYKLRCAGKKYAKRYFSQKKADKDGRSKRSIAYKVDILREEYDAWRIGLEVAKELNLKINRQNYEKHSAICLKTYCGWVCDSGNYEY